MNVSKAWHLTSSFLPSQYCEFISIRGCQFSWLEEKLYIRGSPALVSTYIYVNKYSLNY